MAQLVNVMDLIWESVDKAEDGKVRYPLAFIDFLWDHGFVDTKKYSKPVWRSAFDPFKQGEDLYCLTRDSFLSLDKYRYTGEIRIPFDAMMINEGKYTDEGFAQLVGDAVAPSCTLEPKTLQTFIEELKNEFRQPDGLLLIQIQAKMKIKKLLEEFPSPLRRFEIVFDEMFKAKETAKKVGETAQRGSITATPEQLAQLQTSTFSQGATSVAEEQAHRLRQMTQAKAKMPENHFEGGDPLKKIKRSKKGIRG